MAFFNDTATGGFQPKRKFRFLVSFSKLGNMTFMVKSVNKPSCEVKSTEHAILNHKFKFPGIVTWKDVSCTFIDAVEPNIGSKFYNALRNSGYVEPTTEGKLVTGLTKVQSTNVLGEVYIDQLDGGGIQLPEGGFDPGDATYGPDLTQIVERWTLKNAWIKGVTFGEGLGYDQEDLVEVKVDIVYDFANYELQPSAYNG